MSKFKCQKGKSKWQMTGSEPRARTRNPERNGFWGDNSLSPGEISRGIPESFHGLLEQEVTLIHVLGGEMEGHHMFDLRHASKVARLLGREVELFRCQHCISLQEAGFNE